MKESHLVLNQNPGICAVADIPIINYAQFYHEVSGLLKNEKVHLLSYFPMSKGENVWQFFCVIADDEKHEIRVYSHECLCENASLESLTPDNNSIHIFEREMHENFGIDFPGHPWLKPVRWPSNRADRNDRMDDYPFFNINSPELHEVGVGPVHAGVIEPGHFRFICHGEKVKHLEIHLGYQHRGIEELFVAKETLLQKAVLSENVAGDTAVGHSLCHAQLVEKLAGEEVCETLQVERIIALELERMAVHIGDTAALCGDVAYQLGQVVCESLRTIVINTTQYWCGNRLGKGFVRAGGSHYPMQENVTEAILSNLKGVESRFNEMAAHLYSMPGALSRFDGIGIVTKEQALRAGLTGMAARMCELERDARKSHPFQAYKNVEYQPVTFRSGDVLARALMRRGEIQSSINIIRDLIEKWKLLHSDFPKPNYRLNLAPDSFCVSIIEGWRGEIVHVALTSVDGKIKQYKIVDPSFHNWMGLALAVRNQEISDFPVCNKSFNLSYCGFDL